MKKLKNIHPTTQYALDITKKKIPSNRWIFLACKRHLDDLKNGGQRGLYFDEVSANHIISFFPEFLSFYEGDFCDKPFYLTPHQKFVVGSIFGWKKVEDDLRRFKTAYIEEAKGNGKSPLAGGIGLYGLTFDDEPGAEIYAAAVTKEQAGILFRDAHTFAEESEELFEILTIDKNNIAYISENSFFRPISSEHRGLDGKRPHVALIDEIHEHPNDMVVRKMSAGTKTRRQPLIFEITNALAVDTKIPTPTGWKTMESLEIGDEVFDEEGRICFVLETTDKMYNHDCYEVVFDDDSKIIADAGHLWETEIRQSCKKRSVWEEEIKVENEIKRVKYPARKKEFFEANKYVDCACGCGAKIKKFDKRGNRRYYVTGHNFNTKRLKKLGVRTTLDIKNTLRYYKNQTNHKVKLTKPLRLPDVELPIDPYFLGCWLGDGNSKDTGISVHKKDEEIFNHIEKRGLSLGRKRSTTGGKENMISRGIGIKGHGYRDTLHNVMKDLGLLNNKHIPELYLRSSYEQRLMLLQGLMDTDGSITKRGRCIFTQHNYSLIKQVEELINSLGIKASLIGGITTLNGKKFKRWDVHFSPDWEMPIFKLKRKLDRHHRRHNRIRKSQGRKIVDVKCVDSVPVKCIRVSSPSRLYLAGESMIPTHNSGYDRHSICFQHHEYTEKILEGLIEDDTWFGMMSGLDVCDDCKDEGKTIPQDGCEKCDDWRDPKVWEKANPNMNYLGQPFLDYLKKQVNEAKNMPSQQNIVKRLNFCIWTESYARWISSDRWAACNYKVLPEKLKGKTGYAGLDLSSNIDITALIYVFPPWEDPLTFDGNRNVMGSPDKYQVLCRFFIPEDNIMERVHKDKVPYDVWIDQGYITATPGNIIDYGFIIEQIKKDSEQFLISELAFDRWGSQKITTDLQDSCGFQVEGKEKTLIQFGQGFASMSAPTKEVEKMVLAEEFAHSNNPVLSWMMSNVVIKTDAAENKKPDKEKSTERIDGAVGLIMAVDRAVLKNQPKKPAYDGLSVEDMKARMAL